MRLNWCIEATTVLVTALDVWESMWTANPSTHKQLLSGNVAFSANGGPRPNQILLAGKGDRHIAKFNLARFYKRGEKSLYGVHVGSCHHSDEMQINFSGVVVWLQTIDIAYSIPGIDSNRDWYFDNITWYREYLSASICKIVGGGFAPVYYFALNNHNGYKLFIFLPTLLFREWCVD